MKNFRLDINGLRALAVIAVVIFHFNSQWIPGGFVGVDIFFVISGFLMTSIIFKGLENNSFSLRKFYLARANRIIPALTVVCFVLIVFGWFFLYNSEYQDLGRHIQSSLLFWSNQTYWLESGYFDASSHEKWLLHTWSLSAEWQFYLIYPLGLLLLSKLFRLETIKKLLILATFLGFIFCVYASLNWPDAAYFLLPTRAWQMLVGGLAFLYPVVAFKNKNTVEFVGLSFIFISCFFISSDNLWPGYLSIFPVLGTYLIIQSNKHSSIITHNRYLQKIGLWSYSIYLWHWPIVVYINNFIDNINSLTLLIGMFLSIVLGYISFKLIEKPNHKLLKWSLFIVTIISSTYVLKNHGVQSPIRDISQSSINDFVKKYKSYNKNNKLTPDFSNLCNVSKKYKNGKVNFNQLCLDLESSGGVFFWGDSHMGALAKGLRSVIPTGTTINQVTSSGCPSSFNIKQGNISKLRQACDNANALVLASVSKIVPKTVIIANKDNHQLMDWQETVDQLKSVGVKQVILLGPVPQWYPSLPLVYAKKAFGMEYLTSNKLDKNVLKTNEVMLSITEKIPDLLYIDAINHLCNKADNNYACKVVFNEELLVWDYGHLTIEGSKYVAKQLLLPHLTLNSSVNK